jgi:hypothetical protein
MTKTYSPLVGSQFNGGGQRWGDMGRITHGRDMRAKSDKCYKEIQVARFEAKLGRSGEAP